MEINMLICRDYTNGLKEIMVEFDERPCYAFLNNFGVYLRALREYRLQQRYLIDKSGDQHADM